MSRVAVVDIGTNSTRLLVADVSDGSVTELQRESIVTRLGEGVDATGALGAEPQQRVFAALDQYAEAIERHGADVRRVVLTSAVRDAGNGPEFADTVRERYGLTGGTLSGDEEARLSFLGATATRADVRPVAGDRHRRRLDRDGRGDRRNASSSTSRPRSAWSGTASATCTPTRRPRRSCRRWPTTRGR